MIALMKEAIRTSETFVSFYQTTRRNFPQDSHLQGLGSVVSDAAVTILRHNYSSCLGCVKTRGVLPVSVIDLRTPRMGSGRYNHYTASFTSSKDNLTYIGVRNYMHTK
jgi:hypothetical protein